MRCIEQCSARKTYPQLSLHPLRLVSKHPAIQILNIGHGDVVVERVRRLQPSAKRNQAREMLPTQKTQDAIHFPFVNTWGDQRPSPVQWIKTKC